MKRRGGLCRLAAGICAVVAFAGCSSPEPEPAVPEPAPVAAVKPAPTGLQVAVPRAVRSLDAHVQAIVAQVPELKCAAFPIQFHHDVDTERTLEWGAEGPYWDVVLSFMKAASLEIVETWLQTIHLGVGPSEYCLPGVSAECLVGFRRSTAPGVVPAVIEFKAVGPCWKDVLGWTVPKVVADPAIEPPVDGGPVVIPEGTRHLAFAATLITRTRVSTHSFPLEIGKAQPVPGTGGTITVTAIRNTPRGYLGVSWTPDNVELCEHGLLLEDGSFVTPSQGPGWYSSGEREFEPPKSNAVALRVKVVLEKHTEDLKLDLEPAQWLSDPAGGRESLAGTIRWTPHPEGKVLVEMGVITKDGRRVPSRMFLQFGEETRGLPESVPGKLSWVDLSFKPEGEVGYRIVGVDAGRYTVWMRAGNWIESRGLAVPQEPETHDFTVNDAESAELRIAAPEGSEPRLIPDPGEGDEPMLGQVDNLRIFLEPAMKGEFAAKGVKPGRYVLLRNGRSQKVVLKKGRTEIDFR